LEVEESHDRERTFL